MSTLPIGGALIPFDYQADDGWLPPVTFDPSLRSGEDGRQRRTRWVPLQVVHTTKGIPGGRNRTPQTIRPGRGPDLGKDVAVAKWWSTSQRSSGAHGIVDADGSVLIIADLLDVTMFHAGNRDVNEWAVGWEMYQEADASIWQVTIDVTVELTLATCIALGQQFQTCTKYTGRPLPRLLDHHKDVGGIVGHRLCSSDRGAGDGGDFIHEALVARGAMDFDMYAGEDREFWREWQDRHDLHPDGVPGPMTHARAKDAGYRHGIVALGKVDDGEELAPLFDILKHVASAFGFGGCPLYRPECPRSK